MEKTRKRDCPNLGKEPVVICLVDDDAPAGGAPVEPPKSLVIVIDDDENPEGAAVGGASGSKEREEEAPAVEGASGSAAEEDEVFVAVYQAYDVTNGKSLYTDTIQALENLFKVLSVDFSKAKRVNGKSAPYTEDDLIPPSGVLKVVYVSHSAPWESGKRDKAPPGYRSYVSFGKGVGGKPNEYNLHMMEYGRFVQLLGGRRFKVLVLAFCQSGHLAKELMERRAAEYIVVFGDESERGNDGVSAFFMAEFVRLFFKKLHEMRGDPLDGAVLGAFEYAYLELGHDFHGPSDVKLSNGEYKYSLMTTNKTFNEDRARKTQGYINGYHFMGKVWIHSRKALPWTLSQLEERRAAYMATWAAPS